MSRTTRENEKKTILMSTRSENSRKQSISTHELYVKTVGGISFGIQLGGQNIQARNSYS